MLSENQFWTLGTLRRERKKVTLSLLSLSRAKERERENALRRVRAAAHR
jgi:hypothetical protein